VSVDVLTETTIRVPVEAVAAYTADPSNAPEWYVNIESVEWETPPPASVGSRVKFVARFLGRRLAYTYELVELVPNERLVMRTAEGPFPMETTYTWSPAGDGSTRMTLRNRGEPAGFSKVAAPAMAAAMRRANTKDLAALRRILEAKHP
jgi:uncharacterized protein YndB with AHSA1/START domain